MLTKEAPERPNIGEILNHAYVREYMTELLKYKGVIKIHKKLAQKILAPHKKVNKQNKSPNRNEQHEEAKLSHKEMLRIKKEQKAKEEFEKIIDFQEKLYINQSMYFK